MKETRIPSATYRLQFHRGFTLRQAAALVEYLHALGISDCYASPLVMARPGSLHGYDVMDHSQLNPEIGTEADLQEFAAALHRAGMGLLLDVVPNHMCVTGGANPWWMDVLENGPSSPFAHFFDIDWHAPKSELANKVLLPILGDQYGRVLENQDIQVTYEGGAFAARYYETRLPLAPKSWAAILEPCVGPLKALLGDGHLHVLELESILTALAHLPAQTETDAEKLRERQREREVIKRRLAALLEASPEARRALDASLSDLNGVRGVPRSFDRLEALLDRQSYRLSFWRVAADEINYRRFFDINDLAAIRGEEPDIFPLVHALVFRLIKDGVVTGLRVDHVDGLYDPERYLRELQEGCERAQGGSRRPETRPFYIVVEKILTRDERLRQDWPVHGTTGYDGLNHVNGLYLDRRHAQAVHKIYQNHTGRLIDFENLLVTCKKFIMHVSMASELHMLAWRLDKISEQHRWSRDFTLESLRFALREVIACFPVYRTYLTTRRPSIDPADEKVIRSAVAAAKRRNPATSESIFDFIASVLLLHDPEGLDDRQRAERRDFVMRFQQLTGPIMAKGLEDTAFYRIFPLASLNEVGGDPVRFGCSADQFHRWNEERASFWPHTLVATTTHDTKRSEDVRARINALSEIPLSWHRALRRWRELNRPHKTLIDGVEAPDSNEEYLLYQTLIGTWPLESPRDESYAPYVERIEQYMVKAIREAKLRTSWINPNERYERATIEFVRSILRRDRANTFLASFRKFMAPIRWAGIYTSLSQALIKMTMPGVPDLYQGTELWDFSLVDPDNRRPVDFEARRRLLATLDETARPDALLAAPEDGRVKLLVVQRTLRYRREHPELFAQGSYAPLYAVGVREEHICGFARRHRHQVAVTAAARFFLRLGVDERPRLTPDLWADTFVALPEAGNYRDVLTGRDFRARTIDSRWGAPAAEVFAQLPVALLEQRT